MAEIGQRIREERKKRKLTLDQVSKMTKLSKSFLSNIELSRAQPSVASIKNIAHGFGISVVELFDDNQKDHNILGYPSDMLERRAESYVKGLETVKKNSRKCFILPDSNISYDVLTPDLRRLMQAIIFKAKPGENSGNTPVLDHPGEKFLIVLEGIIKMEIGDQTVELEAGDTAYYPSHLPTYWRVIGNDPLVVLIVMTPPSF